MADGRGKEAWGRMSNLLCLIANVNRDAKKGRSFTPDDFNPFVEKKSSEGGVLITADNIEMLRALAPGK